MATNPNNVNEEIIRHLTYFFLERLPKRPNLADRGIVIGVRGATYFANAWVCIGMLRRCGCRLPIQVWYWDEGDCHSSMRIVLDRVGVQTRIVPSEKRPPIAKSLRAQELKLVAALETSYKEVLILDADTVPVSNPEPLFDSPGFLRTGAILWPARRNFDAIGIEKYSDKHRTMDEALELDPGQMLLNKEMNWDALNLALWYSRYSDLFYPVLGGLQGVMQLSFINTQREFAFPSTAAILLPFALYHHDLAGERVFQHRKGAKWEFYKQNIQVEGFLREKECLDLVRQLKGRWSGIIRSTPFDLKAKPAQVQRMAAIISLGQFEYRRIGCGERKMTFLPNGNIGIGSARCERFWDIYNNDGEICLEIASEEEKTRILKRRSNGIWCGKSINHERMAVELVPIKTTLPRKQAQRIVFSAPLNSHTGYGLHAYEIIRGCESAGYDIVARPHGLDESFAPIPADISDKLVAGIQDDEWELTLRTPPDFNATSGKRTVLFTMWESTHLAPAHVSRLNQADYIIVPCQWNKECFLKSGVVKPISVVPLGIHEDVFQFSPMNMSGPCVFGTAGRMKGGGIRKGINNVIRAFQKAFPVEPDVRLLVKGFTDCDIMKSSDRRIQIVQTLMSEHELCKWFYSLTCFVSGAKGEGWGLMQQQAMACGRPIISVVFGGVTEFFDEKVGYEVKFDLAPARGIYEGCGKWAEPNENHLIERMHQVYKNRAEARQLGEYGSQRVAAFTWKNSTRKLLDTLRDIGMLN